jgi:hypothetical protein
MLRSFRIPHSAFIILLALWLLFFWRHLSGQVTYPDGDFTQQFFIFRNIAYRAFAAGHLPLWADCFFAGYPFHADPQSQLFYPPLWILFATLRLLSWGHFPLNALTLEATIHYLLTSIFTFYFLRAEFSNLQSSNLQSLASLLGAITFTYGGYLTGYPPLQTAILETATWLPLILLTLRRLTELPITSYPLRFGNYELRFVAVSALTLALAFFAGHPQTFLFVFYLAAAYFVYRARAMGRAWRWTLSRLVVVCLLLFGLSLVQLLPQAQYLSLSSRSALTFEELAAGFPLGIVNQFFITDATWSPLYIGILPLALAIVAMAAAFFVKTAELRAGVLFWAAVALVSLLLSFGGNTPLYNVAYWLLPGFRLFRRQERLALLVSFSLSVLAAFGAASLLEPLERRLRNAVWAVVLAMMALGAIELWTASRINYRPDLADWPSRAWLMIAGLAFTAVALLARLTTLAQRNTPAWGLGMAALVAVNLFVAATPSNAVAPFDPYPYFPFLDPIRADPDPFFRVQDDARMQGHFACGYGFNEWSGISPIRPAAWAEFDRRARESLRWKMLGVKYLITWKNGAITREEELPPAALAAEGEAPQGRAKVFRLFELPRRAWTVTQYRTEGSRDELFAALNLPGFDPFRQAVLTPPGGVVQVFAKSDSVNREVAVLEDRPGHLLIDVGEGPASLLVVSEAYYPGWAAAVNGQPATVFEADAYLLSVLIPSGQTTVALNYRPWTLIIGGIVSLASLILCISLIAHRSSPIALNL